MTREEFFEAEFAERRIEYERGYYPAAIEAFRLCAMNNLPLPAWLADVVHGALVFTLKEGGKGPNRRKGGFLAQALRLEIHQRRWNTARMWLRHRELLPFGDDSFPATREGAFECASRVLKGTPAQGSAQQVERSYDLVQARLKKATPAKSAK